MPQSLRNFVAKVRNSDDTTKKFWVLLCSVISMFFVVSLWLAYINVSIARIPGPTSSRSLAGVSAPVEVEEELENPGFFSIFAAGTKIIFDALKERLAVKNDIVISKQEVNFVAEGIEPVKPTVLR
ncbi:MAG: hypothetical protein Q7S83_02460 [bacterium]|nr:hypothetical protein [bacterium]